VRLISLSSAARTCAARRSRSARASWPNCYEKACWALHFNEHIVEPGDVVFRHACQLGFEGIVSKRLGSPYVSGRSRHWVKSKNPAAPAVKREAEEDWGR
jgi:hypothetical protein